MFRILIVDDTKSVQAFVQLLLSRSPEVSVTCVGNGVEALELFERNKNFDLVLLDWEMPALNGPQTFQQMKNKQIQIPTVMMTTKNAPQDIQRMLEMGVAEYLMKPFTQDILFEKLAYVSGRSFHYAS